MKTKARLKKKYFKRVAADLRTGRPLPRFYIMKMAQEIERHFFIAYITVFRPWLWDEDHGDIGFVELHNQWHEKEVAKFEQLAGFKIADFEKVFKATKKLRLSQPKPKPRKEKPEPPRHRIKEADQSLFIIRGRDGTKRTVTGTQAFSIRGYNFFVFDDGGYWNVTDETAGAIVYRGYWGEGFKRTLRKARRLIETNIDGYEAELRKKGFI